ncbi:MAG: hypothetical protein IJ524_06505 [Bacteroidales bacterium]|nr:hypothetical protein [Bacteroidales bacterium]
MKEKERQSLDEELLLLSYRRMQAQAGNRLRHDHEAVRYRSDRRHFLTFTLLMLLLLPATGLLTAHRFPYVMKVPVSADREAVNLLATQMIQQIA